MLFSRGILFTSLFSTALLGAAGFALKDGDTVVFYGDSITDQRLYSAFTESYVATRFPGMKVKFVHSGWGGDRVTGGGGGPIDIRLQRDVIAYHPTVVTIMLGMNDGRYRPFDAELFSTYSAGMTQIVKSLKAALPGVRITAILPSPYDDVTRPPQFQPGYNAVLVRYSEFLRDLARREGLEIADLNTGVVAALKKANAADPAQAQKMLPDRVHPGPSGHLVMAAQLLQAWGAPAVVSDVSIDAAAASVTRSTGAGVTAIERPANGISWTETDGALPMPVDWTDPLIKLAADASDVVQTLDQQPLQVTGLAAGPYSLTIDDVAVGLFTAEQLAQGINLATLPTPMLKQAMEVGQLTAAHNNVHFARWRTVQVPLRKYSPGKMDSTLSAMDALEEELVTAQRAAAQPKPHRYVIAAQ